VTDPPFRILTVCTGNICRSPVAERLLRAGLGDAVAVSSAGVRAVVGEPIHPGMVALLEQSGIRADRFAARQVASGDVGAADLVLGLTREHRARLVQEAPAALRRSFTLLEFARIVTSPDLAPVAAGPLDIRLRALVLLAARHRTPASLADSDDVPDPYGHGSAEYELAYGLIRDAVDTVVRVARG
jgi:protein-tyrosine phosphatase